MKVKQFSIILALLILLIPSVGFGEMDVKISTGHDLFECIKLMGNEKDLQDLFKAFYAIGYLNGCLDGLVTMQDTLFNSMFPPALMFENERAKSLKPHFKRLNIPEGGLPVNQLIHIFKKYVEKKPEDLNQSARVCILLSLIDAYGWK